MTKRLFIIFSDFDGVFAHTGTWGNDSGFRTVCRRHKCFQLAELDIFGMNMLDRLCRTLESPEDEVWLVSTSCWKYVFDDAKNRHFISKWAGFKKLKIVKKNRKSFDRFSRYEPYARAKLIKWYLCKYKPAGYVVLDDQYEEYLKGEFGEDNVIHTDQADGLTHNTFQALRSIVIGWERPTDTQKHKQALDALVAGVF